MTPVLYTSQHCPHCIRARMALVYAGLDFELREVDLQHMPPDMLQLVADARLPVLQLSDSRVLNRSLEIVHWALLENDPQGWLDHDVDLLDAMNGLVRINDTSFAYDLLRYQEAERFPGATQMDYRRECELFLRGLEERLTASRFLFGDRVAFGDVAIFPFIHEFSRVELDWFGRAPYPRLRQWLLYFEASRWFNLVMREHGPWENGADPVLCRAQ